jgi:hypothetical protein
VRPKQEEKISQPPPENKIQAQKEQMIIIPDTGKNTFRRAKISLETP